MKTALKIFLWGLAALAALWVGFRVWAYFKAKGLSEIFPRREDAAAALASQSQDYASLTAQQFVMTPSAQNVRTTIGMIDANPIGGNVGPDFGPGDLLSVQRWSPLGSNYSW